MKKQILFCVFLLFLFNKLEAQEFSFQMYFEDAEGNRDTITIGYDPNGSRDTINPDFGEVNIADTPFDSIFDVRITNQADINGASGNYDYDLFHSKKKVVGTDKYINIDIHSIHWPVTAMWDSTLFNENSGFKESLLTPLHRIYWWDSGNYYSNFEKVLLNDTDQITFTENYPNNWEENPIDYGFCYYTDEEGKPIATYWIALLNVTSGYSNELFSNYNKTLVFPNPTYGVVFIEGNNQLIQEIFVYDIIGKQYFIEFKDNKLDFNDLPDGFYLLKIIDSNGNAETHKIIKSKRKNYN